MGRISKNNCDYFPHMVSMRNHRKIKMLRNKFGQVLGYAFWSMMLEYLTEADGNEIEYTDDEIEMFAAELPCEPDVARQMIEYCFNKELLFLSENRFIYSESLNAYLQPVYDKRMRAKKASETRERRENGKFCSSNANNVGKTVTEKPEPIHTYVPTIPEPAITHTEDIPLVEAEEVEELTNPQKKKSKKQADHKMLYATDVRMTTEEHSKLVNEFGIQATVDMITLLDNYKVANGKAYKDDYRAILSWVVKRYKEDLQKQQQYGNKQSSFSQKVRNADSLIDSMYGK